MMRLHGNAGGRARRLALGMTMTAALAAALAACSGSGSTATQGPATQPAAATTAAAPATSAPAAAAASGLSGKWSGQYSGAYNGTFVLHWRQSGSKLSGRIEISAPHSVLGIHGQVSGSSISFGTVGGTAITYSGTVSGGSMSGTYQVQGQGGSAGGPWSASKS